MANEVAMHLAHTEAIARAFREFGPPDVERLEPITIRERIDPTPTPCSYCDSPGLGLRCDSCGAPMPMEAT